jgi:hypothetical protein
MFVKDPGFVCLGERLQSQLIGCGMKSQALSYLTFSLPQIRLKRLAVIRT